MMTNDKPLCQDGFSLVELLISLMFISLLMAGMAKIFSSSIQTFSASNEIIGAQRVNRWALELISDDISQAGFIFPERALPDTITSKSLFEIAPNQSVKANRIDMSSSSGYAEEDIRFDRLTFFSDIPLDVRGTLLEALKGEEVGASAAAGTSAKVDLSLGSAGKLRHGDVMVILDGGEYGSWETPLVKSAEGGKSATVSFITDGSDAKLVAYSLYPKQPGIVLSHPKDTPVMFIRPAQLITYRLEARRLDPADKNVTVPCLVREQRNVDGSNVETQIIAENVAAPGTDAALQVFISTDGGGTYTQAVNPAGSSKDWFRDENCLLRIDLTTRTPIRRSEFSADPAQLDYRYRKQSLVISPRNFGYGR